MAQYSSDRFAKDFPELSSKYTELLEAQRSLKGLDPKTRQLINIGIQTANRSLKGVKYHASMAKKAGATREEVLRRCGLEPPCLWTRGGARHAPCCNRGIRRQAVGTRGGVRRQGVIRHSRRS